MVAITLPDGSVRNFKGSVTGTELAADIGPGLAKAALAVRVGDGMLDLSTSFDVDATVSVITSRDEDALELLRHDTAHVLAEAVLEMYPGAQVTIGPSIENGFYYDFSLDTPFTPEDLEKIEIRMHEIIERDEVITREVWGRDEAIEYFKKGGQYYKAELISDLPEDETITVYKQGGFTDLCRGPHLPSTGKIGPHFKLMKLAGAYWRGNSDNEMLQRVYGTVWPDKKQLKQYLHMLEEAEKRDHRRLGRDMSLFHLQDVAAGSVFWHPHGWTLYRTIQNYMRERLEVAEYVEVNTPQLVDRGLWEDSGHWEKFRENMFIAESEDRMLAIKPMNCPCHVQIFRQGTTSYRDLPMRMAEFGSCHRNEPSGALHGLMRVRAFVQDDAHIFCTEDQITSETKLFCELLLSVYKDFGFDEVIVKFSDRPEVRAGKDVTWDKAEKALKEATNAAGLEWELNSGEGAFYGPKLEFVLRDTIGRDWQCGTLQVDFVLPDRLDANYVGEDGEKHRPVMLHRAILGSFERFIGILIEHYAGKLPLWLAPRQVVIATITGAADDYAVSVKVALDEANIRTELDLRNEKINYKIREHSHAKVPAMLIVGGREAEDGTVALRRMDGKDQEILALKEAVARLKKEAAGPLARDYLFKQKVGEF
jgi:threonyl-tRNA synthetase